MTQTVQERVSIQADIECRECPQWYCVKVTLRQDGTMKSEIVTDEKTKLPIVIQSDEKPLDGAYETATETIYYTYCHGYEAANGQMAVASI